MVARTVSSVAEHRRKIRIPFKWAKEMIQPSVWATMTVEGGKNSRELPYTFRLFLIDVHLVPRGDLAGDWNKIPTVV